MQESEFLNTKLNELLIKKLDYLQLKENKSYTSEMLRNEFSEFHKSLDQVPEAMINQLIKKIDCEIIKLNKLKEAEKYIHIILLGYLKENQLNYLKQTAKTNKDFKVFLWYDFDHILAQFLNTKIQANVRTNIESEATIKHDFKKEAELKKEFYEQYFTTKNPKDFNDAVKQFLVKKRFATAEEMEFIILETKKTIFDEAEKIKELTYSYVAVVNVNEIQDDIFLTESYKQNYLNCLELKHWIDEASERLRYAILNHFGGFYMDSSVSLKLYFNYEKKRKVASWINQHFELETGFGILSNAIIYELITLVNFSEPLQLTFDLFFEKLESLPLIKFKNKSLITSVFIKDFIDALNPKEIGPVEWNELKNLQNDSPFQLLFFDKKSNLFDEASQNYADISLLLCKKNSEILSNLMEYIDKTDEIDKKDSLSNQLISKFNNQKNRINLNKLDSFLNLRIKKYCKFEIGQVAAKTFYFDTIEKIKKFESEIMHRNLTIVS